MKRSHTLVLAAALLVGSATVAAAANECSNPNALGTSRTLAVDPKAFPMVGTDQYQETLALRNRSRLVRLRSSERRRSASRRALCTP